MSDLDFDFNLLAAYQPATPTESETANTPVKTTRKGPSNNKRNITHQVFRKKERKVENEIFELVGVTKEPAGTGPNNETKLYRQRQAVLNKIQNHEEQVQMLVSDRQAMAIHMQNLKAQFNALLSDNEALRNRLAAADNHINGLANYIVNLELENNDVKAQVQARTWNNAPQENDGTMDNDIF
ncbi:hypothetical protein EDD37DRAFT_253869 [Exophiala viscosa]|uniref:Uncharacterized protein n=1 Tax=Exophiala viscosa TaxID=2486360 RepID=A0AAN6E4P3_9EURO|nr:hypothetical protein EDD36DRAFT_413739 [Exophiala viscosa]KAI1627171.1 hypothetical protein EDD37DRAFT_253869 [Exophiala viscosa]